MVALCVQGEAAQDRGSTEGAVELPAYVVLDSQVRPQLEAWRYAHSAEFEVLANGSEMDVQRLISDLRWFSSALSIVWPSLRFEGNSPMSVILCANAATFERFRPKSRKRFDAATSFVLQGRGYAAIVLDRGTKTLAFDLDGGRGAAPGTAGFGVEVEPIKELYRSYIYAIFGRASPSYPPWFVEGVAQLLKDMEITPTRITVGRVEDGNLAQIGSTPGGEPVGAAEWDRGFVGFLKDKPLLPMADLLGGVADAHSRDSTAGFVWAKQCAAFVHWGLYGFGGRNQQRFLRFVSAGRAGSVDEKTFVECFGADFAGIAQELRSYINVTPYVAKEFRAKNSEGLPRPTPLELRDATASEIGRITGDALLHADRLNDARAAFQAAYLMGSRDPDVIGTLGLIEHIRGDADSATKLLERAVEGNSRRGQVYLVLAKIRYGGVAESEALGEAELDYIAAPLLAGAQLENPPAELFELLGTACSRSTHVRSAYFEAMEQGMRRYPRNAGLLYLLAAMKSKNGERKTARELTSRALEMPRSPAIDEKLRKLEVRLR